MGNKTVGMTYVSPGDTDALELVKSILGDGGKLLILGGQAEQAKRIGQMAKRCSCKNRIVYRPLSECNQHTGKPTMPRGVEVVLMHQSIDSWYWTKLQQGAARNGSCVTVLNYEHQNSFENLAKEIMAWLSLERVEPGSYHVPERPQIRQPLKLEPSPNIRQASELFPQLNAEHQKAILDLMRGLIEEERATAQELKRGHLQEA